MSYALIVTKARALLDAVTFDDSGSMVAGEWKGGNGGMLSRDTIKAADALRTVLGSHGAEPIDRQLADALAELTVQRATSGFSSMQAIADDVGPPGSLRSCLMSTGDRPDYVVGIVRLHGTDAEPYRFAVYEDEADAIAAVATVRAGL